jgi:hypothetical protein
VSNQENKADNGKHDPTLLMHDLGKALKAVTAVLNYGAEKYEPRGWKTVEPRRYQSALLRHYNEHYVMGELTDNESGLLHLAHKATNALFLLQLYIEAVENSSKTPPDFYTYKKPPQNHKKSKAPEVTGTFCAPDYTFIRKELDHTYVDDQEFRKQYEKRTIRPPMGVAPATGEHRLEDAFDFPEHSAGYKPECCQKTVLKRCKDCPYGE